MGNQASVPQPGTRFQVIGAGLPRTGTASFSEALRILLDGPVYHGGTQTTLGKPIEIKSWIKVLRHWPPKDEADRKLVFSIVGERLDGYAAVTDSPSCSCVQELMEIYPDAKVICTVRDPDAWVKSMAGVSDAATMWFLRVVLFPLPGMRHFVDYIDGLRGQWVHLYGEREPVTIKSWNRHIEWLKEIVPEDRLVFFDVRDGWGPLCDALGKKAPMDTPFPRINDGEAIDRFAKVIVKRGLMRWFSILATIGLALIAFAYM
ncbi:P-loop containing nucleoside triphosphate hydrolase protein [Lophiotrema nucula]|uniref:P-loop containing nucleoside triphosphate hydrolase protein n=1 Tax=Lophiotrema nucula TaxID=690887 RepID=A0A6A5ZMD8_9PLEO|nr:P-loop containing nucleoside triphosphate hydrolase protein [Lophiotrema nucula]